MLIIGVQFECIPYIIAIVAGLFGDPFIYQHEPGISNFDDSNDTDSIDKEEKRQLWQKYFKPHTIFSKLDSKSDAIKLLSAICAYDYEVEKGRGEIFVKTPLFKAESYGRDKKSTREYGEFVYMHSSSMLNLLDDIPPECVSVTTY